ncbi:MAG: ThuA domain-containing protein [Melioribacteraceae bacterium]|nr:ThuA domain-containing protein [Melioribacteraceae bacterium]
MRQFLKYFFFLTIVSIHICIAGDGNVKNILIVTGGKKIDTIEFYTLFEKLPGYDYDTLSKPGLFLNNENYDFNKYDLFVFYDSYEETTQPENEAFMKIVSLGKGMLFLHHSIISHRDWQEYQEIIGGRYHYKSWMSNGTKYGPSTYKHDQEYTVEIIDETHPVTIGMDDFIIHDEIYINIEINDDVIPILSTDNCESARYVGWINFYKDTKVVYLQPGHDRNAFRNCNYRKLIRNALDWLTEDRY